MDIIREISPYPSFTKRGNTSLWQREVGRILKINVVIIIRLLISHAGILGSSPATALGRDRRAGTSRRGNIFFMVPLAPSAPL